MIRFHRNYFSLCRGSRGFFRQWAFFNFQLRERAPTEKYNDMRVDYYIENKLKKNYWNYVGYIERMFEKQKFDTIYMIIMKYLVKLNLDFIAKIITINI